MTCVIGVAGALLRGWLATRLFHVHTRHGFFNLSTWITTIVGSAILLPAFRFLTRRDNARPARRRPGWHR
jgi:uncharacterized membrane protein YeaQ/YmgE (transglycosylase-associated protein family)